MKRLYCLSSISNTLSTPERIYRYILAWQTPHVHGDIMPEPLTSDIISFHSSCYTYSSHLNNLYNDCLALGTALTAEGCPSSGLAANNMAVHIWDMRNHFAFGADSVRYWVVKCLQWIDTNWDGDGVPVDMSAILNAMWASLDWQTLLFIAYIDAMRGSLSEKTVTETSMANYLRHFM